MDVDRDKDPIGVVRLDSLLKESKRYAPVLDALVMTDKEQAIPLMLLAICHRILPSTMGHLEDMAMEMPVKIQAMRELVSQGPEHVASLLMCLAVETSLIMDRAGLLHDLQMLPHPSNERGTE